MGTNFSFSIKSQLPMTTRSDKQMSTGGSVMILAWLIKWLKKEQVEEVMSGTTS